MKEFDAIIIGFGKCGKTLASDLAKRGKKVAVIEQSAEMYGGTCINVGCIPTKTLVSSAKQADPSLSYEAKNDYFVRSIAHKDELISMLRNKNYHLLADQPNISIFDGIGTFKDKETVLVAQHDGSIMEELHAPLIVINTGAETVIPPIKGIKDNPQVYTSTSIMHLSNLPHHLVVIGGGYIGLEFASMFASFGSQVTVLEGAPVLIGREDRDIADTVKERLQSKGVRFVMNARVNEVKGSEVIYSDREGRSNSLMGDAILLATGRRPNTSGLNPEAAGIEVDERGAIKVDDKLRTSNPNVFAVGDAKGGLQFTYISLDDYRILRSQLFEDGSRKISDRQPVSYSVFIDPPLSRIGMSEEEALGLGKAIKVNKLPVAGIPRARTLNEIAGLFKIVVDAETNKILGCTLFGPESSELINIVAMAMKLNQDYTFLRDFIFTHPSMSEALNDLAKL
ncbi:FAD-dependent oxidoreductase [Falsiporphyromonas endometrii]|uniref:FAD-dependent oxidoreductase n=1 Tax=Falsiporphyromonas endometrii TaxID=1387297 RepID=A0ABV9K6G5_9PORP